MADEKSNEKSNRRSNRKHYPAQAKWTREEYLVDALDHYEQLARDAQEHGPLGAAVKAKDSARIVRAELDQLRETQRRAAEPPPSPGEHREEILREIRRMRIGAQASGSWVAAEKLLVEEQQMLLALEEERRNAEVQRMMEEDLGAIVGEVTSLIATLPDALIDQIQRAIDEKKNPPPPADEDEDGDGEEE